MHATLLAALRVLAPFVAAVLACGHAQAASQLPANADALAEAMRGKRIVVLGEVHDNAAQHALRLAALRKLVAEGARPAIAFEQLDREQQPAIDAARRERPRDAAYLIAQGKGAPSWDWKLYQPFVELALEYDLPIVAANLSRAGAMEVATGAASGDLPALPPDFLQRHERSIARGHCDLLPPEALPGMARAQIARDRTLADAIRPYFGRGVVLLTGNGHARVDLGVPHWLTPEERARSIAIGLLERDRDGADEPGDAFDAWLVTDAAPREDPCAPLRKRMGR